MVTPAGRTLLTGTEPGIVREAWAKFQKLSDVEREQAFAIEALGKYDPQYDLTAPEGTTVLKCYIRRLEIDGEGAIRLPEWGELKIARKGKWALVDQQPQRDYVWFSQAEVEAMIPADLVQGRGYPMPAAPRDRLFLYHVPYSSTCYSWARKTGQVSGELTLTPERVSAQSVRLRLSGRINLGHRFGGVLEFDRAAKKLTRFDMAIFHPKGHQDDKAGQAGPPSLSPLGVSFELAAGDQPLDRLYPIAFTLNWRGDLEVNRRQIADYWAGKR